MLTGCFIFDTHSALTIRPEAWFRQNELDRDREVQHGRDKLMYDDVQRIEAPHHVATAANPTKPLAKQHVAILVSGTPDPFDASFSAQWLTT